MNFILCGDPKNGEINLDFGCLRKLTNIFDFHLMKLTPFDSKLQMKNLTTVLYTAVNSGRNRNKMEGPRTGNIGYLNN